MKVDSILRQINKRINDYVTVFGVESIEYNWAKNVIYTATKPSNEAMLMKKDGVFQIRRGKAQLAEVYDNPILMENLQDVWEKFKERGTAKHIIQTEYINQPAQQEYLEETGLKWNSPEVIEEVRLESSARYESSFDDADDLDSARVREEIDENEMDDPELYQMLGNILTRFYDTGSGIEKDIKWNDITRMWNEYKYAKDRKQRLMASETEP